MESVVLSNDSVQQLFIHLTWGNSIVCCYFRWSSKRDSIV